MTTLSQCLSDSGRIKKAPASRTFKLRQKPQVAGLVRRVHVMAPKKPNSGKRRIVKVKIRNKNIRDRLTAKVSGNDMFPARFYRILIEGGRANDTPGVTYTAVRGTFDFAGLVSKNYRRSVYGLKRASNKIFFIRRCLRRADERLRIAAQKEQLLKAAESEVKKIKEVSYTAVKTVVNTKIIRMRFIMSLQYLERRSNISK
jgi:small subunit ribosomal protein S12